MPHSPCSPDRNFLLVRASAAPLFQTGWACSIALGPAVGAGLLRRAVKGTGSGAVQHARLKLCACCKHSSYAIPKLPVLSLQKHSSTAGTLEDMRASPGISFLREIATGSPHSQAQHQASQPLKQEHRRGLGEVVAFALHIR